VIGDFPVFGNSVNLTISVLPGLFDSVPGHHSNPLKIQLFAPTFSSSSHFAKGKITRFPQFAVFQSWRLKKPVKQLFGIRTHTIATVATC
jgi:hypothetical protein